MKKYQIYDVENVLIYESNSIEDANENIVNNDEVCYCKNTVENCIVMDDRASMFYDSQKWHYKDKFNKMLCIKNIQNLYGINVANWIKNIS